MRPCGDSVEALDGLERLAVRRDPASTRTTGIPNVCSRRPGEIGIMAPEPKEVLRMHRHSKAKSGDVLVDARINSFITSAMKVQCPKMS